MNLNKKYTPTPGYTRIIERGEMGIARLDFGILSLSKGESFFENTAGSEVVLVLLRGQCTLLVGHNGNKAYGIIGEREDVFGGEAYRAYIPCRTTYEIFADTEYVEVAICKALSHIEIAAAIVAPGDDFVDADLGAAMTVAETPIRTISGEAICFYRLHSAEGPLHQRVINDDRSFDQITPIAHNDVLALPSGYHAEFLLSSKRLYCLWIAERR